MFKDVHEEVNLRGATVDLEEVSQQGRCNFLYIQAVLGGWYSCRLQDVSPLLSN